MKQKLVISIFACLIFQAVFSQNEVFKKIKSDEMPYGGTFDYWEKPQKISKTYYVDNQNANASDDNDGSAEKPFKTINKAAQILKAGERVVIKAGVYRESIHPVNSGTGPAKMISFEAAEGEEVVVKGAIELDPQKWKPGQGWIYDRSGYYKNKSKTEKEKTIVWQYDFDGNNFGGYNPFGMMNIQHDREWLQYQKIKIDAHFRRRGMLFLNGKYLEQVEKPVELATKEEGAFWIEHNGMRIHVRFPEGTTPNDFTVEATNKEQLFVPKEYGIGYIRIKGIKFQYVGNGFPVPQRGMISANRGHHWIIEDCEIDYANSLGIDLGNEMWHTVNQPGNGFHVVRRCKITNCGLAGLQGNHAPGYLIEDNWFENIGWQDGEHGFEAGAIKLHVAKNTLIRRNVFSEIKHAPGIWLDYRSNKNCRITQNVFSDIITARGAIYIEVSHNKCYVDHNIMHNLKSQYWISGDYGAGGSGFYTDGSDSIEFFNNLVFDIENTGYGSYFNAGRIVAGRGGIARYQKVTDNIFHNCKKHSIEFPNEYNFSNANLFSKTGTAYLKLATPEPALLLDLDTWNKLFGWEKDGKLIKLNIELNTETLELTITSDEKILTEQGPFKDINKIEKTNIDPRILK